MKRGLFTRIMNLYNSSVFKIVRICAQSVPHVHGHELLDDATGW